MSYSYFHVHICATCLCICTPDCRTFGAVGKSTAADILENDQGFCGTTNVCHELFTYDMLLFATCCVHLYAVLKLSQHILKFKSHLVCMGCIYLCLCSHSAKTKWLKTNLTHTNSNSAAKRNVLDFGNYPSSHYI